MSIWIIEPHDPLIFRDGRPFGPTPGARAFSLPFPFPSTLAGVVRHQANLDGQGNFRDAKPSQETAEEKQRRQEKLDDLKRLPVRGPPDRAQRRGREQSVIYLVAASAT